MYCALFSSKYNIRHYNGHKEKYWRFCMRTRYVIGADIGTMGTKTAVFDELGTLVAEAYEESALHYPRPGWVEQDPADFYTSVLRGIRLCLEKGKADPRRVVSLSIDGQMAGVCTVDEDWGTPTVYDSWLDTRCAPYIDVMKAHEPLIIAKTGGPVSFAHGPKILWWQRERPEVFGRIAKFVPPAGYVAGRLAGLKGNEAFIDYTYLHFSGFSETSAHMWSNDLCGLFGVPVTKLPRIVRPWDIVGKLTKEAAQASGLIEGTPIAAGMGDQPAGALGAGIVEAGMLYDVAGTASVLALCVDRYTPDVEYRTLFAMPSAVEGLWYPLAYINGGGLNLRWFRDEISPAEKCAFEKTGDDFYEAYDRKASCVKAGSEGLLFLPHLAGRVCPNDPSIRGLWAGFSWAHTKAHFYRSLLEGVAYEYGYYLKIVRELAPDVKFTQVRVLGGGSKSSLWNQIKADVLGLPYVRLNREEFAVLGSAIVAGHSVGLFPDIKSTAQAFIQPGDRIEPRGTQHEYYQKLLKLYIPLFDVLRETFEGLTQLPEAP
jgi:xylulokinase